MQSKQIVVEIVLETGVENVQSKAIVKNIAMSTILYNDPLQRPAEVLSIRSYSITSTILSTILSVCQYLQ